VILWWASGKIEERRLCFDGEKMRKGVNGGEE
jgi:hypothetical protein